jgi:hypothetical protein
MAWGGSKAISGVHEDVEVLTAGDRASMVCRLWAMAGTGTICLFRSLMECSVCSVCSQCSVCSVFSVFSVFSVISQRISLE